MYVTEIYKTILGESSYAGFPGVIVRLSGCNLKCNYCDTTYSLTQGEEKSIGEIVGEVKKLSCSYVTITGGEPLLQRQTGELARQLILEGYTVLLETNGSVPVNDVPPQVIKIIDIKCPGSGMSQKINWDNFNHLLNTDEIKFVLSCEEDYKWSIVVINKYLLTKRCNVLFSPVQKHISPSSLAQWILRDNLRVRIQLQLHTLIGVK